MINGTLPFMKLVQNGPRYEIVLVPYSISLWDVLSASAQASNKPLQGGPSALGKRNVDYKFEVAFSSYASQAS